MYSVAYVVLSLPMTYALMNIIRLRGKAFQEATTDWNLLEQTLKGEVTEYGQIVPTDRIKLLANKFKEDGAARLIESTRDQKLFPTVYSEVKFYGFIRNCLAIKPQLLWLNLFLIACLFFGAYFSGTNNGKLLFPTTSIASFLGCALALGALSIGIIGMITRGALKQASINYVKAICQAGLSLCD